MGDLSSVPVTRGEWSEVLVSVETPSHLNDTGEEPRFPPPCPGGDGRGSGLRFTPLMSVVGSGTVPHLPPESPGVEGVLPVQGPLPREYVPQQKSLLLRAREPLSFGPSHLSHPLLPGPLSPTSLYRFLPSTRDCVPLSPGLGVVRGVLTWINPEIGNRTIRGRGSWGRDLKGFTVGGGTEEWGRRRSPSGTLEFFTPRKRLCRDEGTNSDRDPCRLDWSEGTGYPTALRVSAFPMLITSRIKV